MVCLLHIRITSQICILVILSYVIAMHVCCLVAVVLSNVVNWLSIVLYSVFLFMNYDKKMLCILVLHFVKMMKRHVRMCR